MQVEIEVLRNLGNGLPQYTEGQVCTVDEKVAQMLCQRGLAKQIRAIPAPPVKAVPPEEGTVEKAEADLKAYRDKHKKKAETSE